MKDIVAALEECERLKKTPLIRSDRKRIFEDYGRPVYLLLLEYRCHGIVGKFLTATHSCRICPHGTGTY
jgi:hypothetical protein